MEPDTAAAADANGVREIERGEDLAWGEDLGRDYLARRETAAIDDPIARARMRAAGAKPSTGSAGNPELQKLTTPEPEPPSNRATAAASAVGAVAKGAAEAPGQLVMGAIEGGANTLGAIEAFADWASGSGETVMRDLARGVGETYKPESVGGTFARATGQFLFGFMGASKLIGGLRAGGPAGRAGKALTAGAIGDFFAQAPDQARMADWWKQSGMPENVLTDFLAADPADTEAEKRFKNALEGSIAGAALDGAVLAVKAGRAAMLARAASDGDGAAAAKVVAEAARTEAAGRDFLILGDPNAPLLQVKAAEPAGAAAWRRGQKLTEGMSQLDGLDPYYAAGAVKRFADKAKAAREAIDKAPAGGVGPVRPVSEADLDRLGVEEDRALYADVLTSVRYLQATQRQLDKSRPPDLMAFIASKGGLREDAYAAGELAAMGITPKTRPGFVRKDGLDLDSMAELAWQNGYFRDRAGGGERPTVNEFLDALRDDFNGRVKQFPEGSADWVKAREDLAELEKDLSEIGIVWNGQDEASIIRQLKENLPRDREAGAVGPDEIAPSSEALSRPIGAQGLPELGGDEVFINFGKISTADDIKAVMGQMADAFASKIDAARRGVQDNETTARLADQLGMSVGDLLARRKGAPFNAEQALAARQLWASSAEKLMAVAGKAAGPNAGPIDQYNFRKMLAVHYAIQAEVVGARTETARALQAWSIPAGSNAEKLRQVETLLAGMGGEKASAEVARRLALLQAGNPDPGAMSAFVRKAWAATSLDVVREAWVNALLSSPKTHVVNVMSNTGVMFQAIYERKAAESLSGFVGTEGGVVPGEAAAMAYGLIEGAKDAFRLAAKALKTGESSLGLTKTAERQPAISAAGLDLDEAGTAGRFVDLLGELVRVPTRALGAEDEFFKSIGYRMELRAQALRLATQEGRRGADLPRRIEDIMLSPPEFIRMNAADSALYNTFSNAPGEFGKSILKLREAAPLTAFVLTFVKTPVNIARYSFERSPLAPLVGQWRDDIAAGGARKDLALARMGTGSMIMLTAADLADRGVISGAGPDDPGEREALSRQGWQPFSVRIGDRWYSYNRTDPFGMTIGLASDLAYLVKRHDIEPDEVDEISEVVGAAIAAVSRNAVSKTYLKGVADFMEMVADPERYSADYINNFLASFVPAASGFAVNVMGDGNRETMDAMQAVQARIPGLAAKLPPRRDLWGAERKGESGLGGAYDALSPIQANQIRPSPIDGEMQSLNLNVRRITKKIDWSGVPVDLRDWPAVYDAYVRLAGNELKHPAWNLGAKDYLDAVVSGRHELSPLYRMYSDGEQGGKAGFIEKTIEEYRKLARAAIVADPQFSDFAAAIGAGVDKKAAAKMPRLAQ